MINILIVEDNIRYAVNLMNYINNYNKDIKVCNIAKNGKETLEILNNKNNIDVILLDYKMPFYNGQQILEKINEKDKYDNSIIIISGEAESFVKLRTCKMVYSILYKTAGLDKICEDINNLLENKEFIKKNNLYNEKIKKEILYLGYNISHKGTQYLIKAIEYIALNPDKELAKLEKNVYPIISKRYNTSVHNVKCRINRATTEMYYNCEVEKLKKYFNFCIDSKPRVKTVIDTIISKLF